jgi:hypothetical protein
MTSNAGITDKPSILHQSKGTWKYQGLLAPKDPSASATNANS